MNLLSEDVNAETETESSVVAKCRYKDRLPGLCASSAMYTISNINRM